MKDLEKLLEANTNDGVIDFKKVEEIVNEEINNIVAKKTDSEKLKGEALETVIAELGLENVNNLDGVKTYLKKMGGNTDEIKEANLKLEAELEKTKEQLNLEMSTREKLEQETKKVTQLSKIAELGITGKQAEFLIWDLNKSVDDKTTFDDLLGVYAKENKDTITTTKIVKDKFGIDDKTDNIYEAWAEKRK